MNKTTGSDIQNYSYCRQKAEENGIEIIVEHSGFIMKRKYDGAMLGKVETVRDVFHYLCGYESGYAKCIDTHELFC